MGCRSSSGRFCTRSARTPGVVIFGTGNVATHLARGLYDAGVDIIQIFGRNPHAAAKLAHLTEAEVIDGVDKVVHDADLYILAVSDSAVEALASALPPVSGVVVHTAGSVPLSACAAHTNHFGVLYPLQTFSLGREISWENVPIFIEADCDASLQSIHEVAAYLSNQIHPLSSAHRMQLHLAAVFVANFVNHCYAAGYAITTQNGLNPDWLHPLMQETLDKAVSLRNPLAGQTGPALRGNAEIISLHLSLLEQTPALRALYESMSRSIFQLHHPDTST
ncbi:MAG: Rossmann-like and DUF2520 domain-containing protein [Bacteroidales bacterium]